MNVKTRPLTLAELQNLLKVSPPTWRFIFSLGYITAFRVSDMIDLSIDHIFPGEIRKIEIKTQKLKKVTIGNSLRPILNYFMSEAVRSRYSNHYLKRPDKILPFTDPSTYRKALVRYATYAMIDLDRVAFHSLRKTSATQIAQNLSIVTASNYLNHSHISTTMAYLDYDSVEISSLLEANHLLTELEES